MKGFIYKITNKVNGKSYIGQTRYTVEFRWRQHKNKKDNSHFHLALQKYGVDNFTVEVLEECDYKDLDSREIYYIAKYDTFNTGYNSTIGGNGKRKVVSDTQYDEIVGLYLAGFSGYKIASLYNVDKATILKLLRSLGIKIRSNTLNINKAEFEELKRDYENGYSLKSLGKRYNCAPESIKDLLIRKGVDIKIKYNILNDEEQQQKLIDDYLDGAKKLSEIQSEYHCSYATLCKILSKYGISKGKKHFKLSEKECLNVIKDFNQGSKVSELAKKYEVDKCTIYSLLRRYHINYLTV